MADPYAFARSRVAAKLKIWNTGVVTLTRNAGTYLLDARVDGVIAQYVNDTTIRATDRMIIASPNATLAGTAAIIEPRMTDMIMIDGKRAVVKEVKAIPAAGQAAMFHIIIGS